MNMSIDMTEIDKMANRYANGVKVVNEEIRKGMTDSVIQIEADAKRRVATDTHALQRSITHEVVNAGSSVTGRVGTNKTVEGGDSHGALIEYGRTPGKMPPAGALLPWMRRHGIDPGKAPGDDAKVKYYSVEYVIARTINKSKRPRPFLKPAYDVNRLKISREFSNAVPKRIFERLGHG